MTADIVKYGFIAGEISPTLYGRTDLTKYDLAVAEGLNFFVDYRGGLTSRPGTKYIATVDSPSEATRTWAFSFAPDTANNYIILFGGGYIRFLQDGGYVLSGMSPYQISSPYTAADLESLNFEQYRDLLRITSPDFPTYNLIRSDHANWTLVEETFSPFVAGPEIQSSTASEAGDAQVVFGVTKVLSDGTESCLGPLFKTEGVVNYPATEGSVSIVWDADPDAEYYNVYRSVVSVSEVLLPGVDMGYVGRAYGTKFTDPNIIPDFSRVPPINFNPFAPGAILKVNITTPGTGYTAFGTTVTAVDWTGSGFVGEVVVDDAGAIVNVIIKSGGEGYDNPSFTFTGGGGVGATATATLRESEGTYPALSKIFQQRQVYAASLNNPITIWGSRIKQFSNFAASPLVLDDDAFEFDLDTAAIAPIRHLLSSRGGLLVMTQDNVWLLNGGTNSAPVTPTNALAEPQAYTGVSSLRPIAIGNDLLFAEGKGDAIRMLAYNEASRVYSSDDKSILSSHLFGPGKKIIRWGYQESPFKVVWAVREDGKLLAYTTVKAEEVFAWTPCETKGKVVDLVISREDNEDRVYLTVQRYVGGALVKYIECMDLRQFVNVEDAWCVDCGLSLPATYPAGTIQFFRDADTDTWTVTGAGASVGQFIRGANGIFKVLPGGTLEMFAEPTNFIPETNNTITFPIPSGEWTRDTPTDELSGLDHLEGETVSILGDGNVFPPQVVSGGAITLPHAVSRAIVGLPFTCRAKTLPIVVPQAAIESKRKRIVGIGVRLDKSRGIKIGPTLDLMTELRERSTEPYGQPIRLVNGMHYQLQYGIWDEEGQTYLIQEHPLPLNILSLVFDLEVGDEAD